MSVPIMYRQDVLVRRWLDIQNTVTIIKYINYIAIYVHVYGVAYRFVVF